MAERRFRVSAAARQDLVRMGRFTEQQWGTAKRNAYLLQLDEAFQLISENSGLGRACDDIIKGYRKFPQGSHVIYYRVTDRVEIIRILQARMDPDANFP